MQREEIQLLIISFSIVLFTLLITLFILFFFFQNKKSKFLLDKMEAELLLQTELTKSKIEIKEQTLTNVSRELHDNVGQILSVALMQMNIIIENDSGYSKNNFIGLKELITRSLNEIRVLSKLINGDITLKSNFIDAITDDLNRIATLKRIECKLSTKGSLKKINSAHEIILYRILQESVSNILKHSQSETIVINILFTDEKCEIRIIDTGKGFNYEKCKKGSGLFNMKTRSELIGATLTIFSTPYKGSELIINYPFQRDVQEKKI